MSSPGRLWRRAPAWRLTIIGAVAFTALAAMFPPSAPHWVLARLPGRPARADTPATSPGEEAQYAAEPDRAPRTYGSMVSPPIGNGRTGIIPFAGRQLTLPAGAWQELALARAGGAGGVRVALLGRLEEKRATGLILAAAPDPLSSTPQLITALDPCFDPGAIAQQTVQPEQNHDFAARECWALTTMDIGNADERSHLDDVTQQGLDRLGQMNVAVAGHLLALRYLRSDTRGWMTVLLLLPDRRAEQKTSEAKLQVWIRRWVSQLHKGFEGAATAGELAAAAAHEPE